MTAYRGMRLSGKYRLWSTIGVLAASYASALAPQYARTAMTLSGVINGVGTLLLVLLVDPVSALITDQALSRSLVS